MPTVPAFIGWRTYQQLLTMRTSEMRGALLVWVSNEIARVVCLDVVSDTQFCFVVWMVLQTVYLLDFLGRRTA
jgi:hypothetical protein